MQSKDAIDGVQFGGLDELGMCDSDGEQDRRAIFPKTLENPLAPGNSETCRNPAKRKFAAASADPDGDKRFPLLSVRSLKTCFLKSLETASFLTMPTSSPTEEQCTILNSPKRKTFNR
jgi:hypothetical protein